MSVLACSVFGCTNVMCDRYSPVYGYICEEHFERLVECGTQTDILDFMGHEVYEDGEKSYDYFNEIFPDRNQQ